MGDDSYVDVTSLKMTETADATFAAPLPTERTVENSDDERMVSDLLESSPDVDVFFNASDEEEDDATSGADRKRIDMEPVKTRFQNCNVEENSEPPMASKVSRNYRRVVKRSDLTGKEHSEPSAFGDVILVDEIYL